ncbi:MAG: lysine--tRNA ligase [Patescibacteria group bacterium]
MLKDILREKERKLEKYKKHFNPYPARVKRGLLIDKLNEDFSRLEKSKKSVSVAGRLRALRDQGKIIFGNLEDESGKIQIVLNEKETENFDIAKETLDVGDFLWVSGKVFKTKRGEKSLFTEDWKIISKNLRPIPQEWYGLEDVEKKFRERYLDLLLNPEIRELFIKKSKFWDLVRSHLKKEKFLEVETPVFESVPGGAEAEPFRTHHNALQEDFYLRISLELPLKKLLVGGYEKVFEIGRIFRNEGIDREHLQDYTQMECYAAYWDYNDMMKFTESLYKKIIKTLFNGTKTKIGEYLIDWRKKWPKVDYYEVFKKESGLDLKKASESDLFKKAKELGLIPEKHLGRGRLIDLIYKKTVRPTLVNPCFLVDHPVDVEPLAKRLSSDSSKVERFQIMALGTELGKGFSELNDPTDQRKRFLEQSALREKGDKEAQRLDEGFLEALEYGMPPASGFGMSERFFAVLMDKSVRECVVFPLMKSLARKSELKGE